MCGIVGYIGYQRTTDEILIELLKHLEYRGYDSAGVAVLGNDKITVNKTEGKIANLERLLQNDKTTHIGIAHTRWATHGKPNNENAHPHQSSDKKWAIVHNGIIENFGALKKELQKDNVQFESETDTEVIAKLLEKFDRLNKIDALKNVCDLLQGSWSLACLHESEKDKMFLARNKSPLYVACNDNEVFVASDPICFFNRTNDYYPLEDGEFCIASLEKIEFFNKNGEPIMKVPTSMGKFDVYANKQEYSHYMLKEIMETPFALQRLSKTYSDVDVFKHFTKEFLKNIYKIRIVGCGTAYHAGMMGARYIEKLARIDCTAHIASEFRYSNPIIDEHTLCICVSQSGETADTLAALDLAKEKGATCVALTNVLYSTIAKKADIIFPVCAGPEIAVASTKAYTCQITAFYMFASHLKNVIFNDNIKFVDKVIDLAKNIKMPEQDDLEHLAEELAQEKQAFFIGRGMDYVTAEEASLKLKEITYINSTAHPSGELKHGFLALIEKGTYLFVYATDPRLLDKTINGAHEAAARGAKIVLVSQLDVEKEQLADVFAKIELQKCETDLMPIIAIPCLQMLSYMVSVKKGINPDQPRNLAKSVTVE